MLYLICDDTVMENADLFVRAANTDDATAAWRDYYELERQVKPSRIIEVPDAAGGDGAVGWDAVTQHRIEDGEVNARMAGWDHGGDNGGIWYHRPTWGSWKAAVSWSGTDQEPEGDDAKPAIYDTLEQLCDAEGF